MAPLGRKVEAVIDYDGCTIDPDDRRGLVRHGARRAGPLLRQGLALHDSAFMRLKLGDALLRREMAPHVFETAAEEPARTRPTAG